MKPWHQRAEKNDSTITNSFPCAGWQAWLKVGESLLGDWRTSLLPLKHHGRVRHLLSALSGRPSSVRTVSLCPTAVCFPTYQQIQDESTNVNVKDFWSLSSYRQNQRHRGQKTSHGFWLLLLLCRLLICVIWVSIKHYEIQSVQTDISKAIFIHMGNIQPL